MGIAELFLPECMTMDLQASTKWEAIRKLSMLLLDAGRIASVEAFEQAVVVREQEVSTGVGFGVGIPHGKSSSVLKPSIAFGRSNTGIPFDAIDEQPVQLVFLLAVPELIDDREYLSNLAKLARLIVHEDFRQKLMEAGSIEDVLNTLRENGETKRSTKPMQVSRRKS